MAKRRASKKEESKGTAKSAGSKIGGASKAKETVKVNFKERMHSLEKNYVEMVESINKSAREVEYDMKRAFIEYESELRGTCGTEGAQSKLVEIDKSFSEKQLELGQSDNDSRKEKTSEYLDKLKKGWADLQASNPDFSELGDIGHVFWDLASRAQHINGNQ